MVALPPKETAEGVEARLLLAECRSPAYQKTYSLGDATQAMQLMDRVLWNRLKNPRPFGAPGATELVEIIKAKGQFAGFENYPNYDTAIVSNLQGIQPFSRLAIQPRCTPGLPASTAKRAPTWIALAASRASSSTFSSACSA